MEERAKKIAEAIRTIVENIPGEKKWETDFTIYGKTEINIIHTETFLKMFDKYEIRKRDEFCRYTDYPCHAETYVDGVRFYTLLSVEELEALGE